MGEFWFKFTAFNEQARYGYGTAMQASDYADKLNWSRTINHFWPQLLESDEVAELGLEEGDLGFNLYEVLASE